jgi:A/G-specific adenine glycosylase
VSQEKSMAGKTDIDVEGVINWFGITKRDLPWRNTTPWGVMVSEFMLQQTPVNRVLPVWTSWIERWPTPADLGAAKKSDAITAWGRLGYPKRAIRLHESAFIINRDFQNEVPQDIDQLMSLPGVGEYTASAIAAFAFNQSALVLDINIRRLFARVIDGQEHPTSAPSQTERARRSELIPADGATWAAATMELGALICKSRNPTCDLCPLAHTCSWKKTGYPKSQIVRKSQKWEGTDRRCRGLILQALRESHRATSTELKKLWDKDSQVEQALKTLLADGLIQNTGKSFTLAD